MSRHVPRHTFQWSPPPPPPPPCHGGTAGTGDTGDTSADHPHTTRHSSGPATTHPMWRYRGTARPSPRRGWVSSKNCAYAPGICPVSRDMPRIPLIPLIL